MVATSTKCRQPDLVPAKESTKHFQTKSMRLIYMIYNIIAIWRERVFIHTLSFFLMLSVILFLLLFLCLLMTRPVPKVERR